MRLPGVSPRVRRVLALLLLFLSVADGVGTLVFVYLWARTSPPDYTLFWLGMFLLLVPLWILVASTRVSALTTLAAITGLGVATYLPSFLRAPNRPVFGDAMAHYLSVEEVLRGRGLLASNPIVPIAADFPGLHTATAALVGLTGLPIWDVAVMVVAACHVATLLGIFAIVTTVSDDRRVACVAVLLYSISPEYLFFDSQFAYETLAVPLLIWAVALLLLAGRQSDVRLRRLLVSMACACGLACVVTHHLTSYVLTALLLGLAAASLRLAERPQFRTRAIVASVVAGAAAGWALLTGAPVLSYLGYFPRASFDAIGPIVDKLLGRQAHVVATKGAAAATTVTRSLFSGSTLPAYEHVAAYVVQVVALVAVGAGIWRVRHRLDAATVVLVVLALSFFVTLPLRLSAAGEAAAGRVATYQWIGIAVTGAFAVGRPRAGSTLGRARILALRAGSWLNGLVGPAALAVLGLFLVGNYASSVNAAELFPGPFQLASSDGRDTTPEAVRLSSWYLHHYGPGRVVVADGATERVFEAYAFARSGPGALPQWQLFYAASYSSAYLHSLARRMGVSAIVVDRRLVGTSGSDDGLLGYPPPGLGPVTAADLHALESLPWLRRSTSSPHYEVLTVDGGAR